MRTVLWNNLMNVRFQAFYYQRYAGLIDTVDRLLAVFLAVLSSTAIGTWLIWRELPVVWASLVGLSQVMTIARPFFPILRQSAEFGKCSLELERLAIEGEKLWLGCERGTSEQSYEKAHLALRDKQHKIDSRYAALHAPKLGFITRAARADIDDYVRINFPSDNEQTKSTLHPGAKAISATSTAF